jgi:hypothetical protein
MRKSVIGILGVAALAASSFAIDTAVAREHGGGGRGGGSPGGSAAFSHGSGGGGRAQSFGGRVSGPVAGSATFQGNRTARSFARTSGAVSSPSFQSNRSVSSFGGGRQFSDRRFDRDDFRHHHHRRNFAFAAFPFGFNDGYYNDYAYDYDYDDCYQVRRIRTPYGWRWRRIDVCAYSDY